MIDLLNQKRDTRKEIKDIISLYRKPSVKCLITLTRGEGFGLPILEAAASGLGYSSFADAVAAYNEQYGTSYTTEEAAEALGQ